MNDPQAQRLAEERQQALADLDELDAQQASGEIDSDTADRLRAIYLAEAALEAGPASPSTHRSTVRVLVGFLLFAIAAGAVAFAVVKAVEPRREGGIVTGGIVSDAVDDPVSLDDVTNTELEAVVAANPDIIGMRLALARRYFEAGDYSASFGHYFEVVQQDSNNAEALAVIGWLAHQSGESDVGISYLERALAVAPDHPDAVFFLAIVRIDTGDTAEAIKLLELMLSWDDLTDEFRAQISQTLSQARAS